MTAADPADTPPWWEQRARRFDAARAALRDKPVLTVLQPFGRMDNDIPGLDVQFGNHSWFANNPQQTADIYFNQGYDHNIAPLWDVVRSGRAAVAACWFWDNHHAKVLNLRTALVEHGPVRREFRTVGTVTYNEEGLRDITTKYEGWLEKLLVNTTWAVVKAGDPLFEIYAPDVYNAQLNYVVALRAEGEAGGALTRGALARLQLYDVPADMIAELNRTKEPHRTLVFRAPADGVVIEKMGVTGQMMKPGERIYRLADLSSVWVQAEIYEKDLPFVRTDDAAKVRTSYGPDRSFEGKVELLLPQVQEKTRTATARIVLANTDRFLRPGMFVDVRFTTQLADDAVLVPDLAVLRSGERNTVFLARPDGSFEPREIKLGARSQNNFYEVLSGLVAGDRIVISGQFMLDSESQRATRSRRC